LTNSTTTFGAPSQSWPSGTDSNPIGSTIGLGRGDPPRFDPGTGTPLLLAGGLEIIAPPSDIIVLMKIAAGGRTPNDALDLRSLWPTTSFLDTEQAVAAFYAAYPHEEPDPHLADWIRSVVGR
jgi:hypothetical protein